MCNHKLWGIILGVVIILFTLWDTVAWTSWLVVIAGIIILFYAFKGDCCTCETEAPVKAKPKKKK